MLHTRRRRYDGSMASIMIVDDSTDSSEALAKFLQKIGHTATCYPNGREALVGVISHPPDVIVLDLRMPEMDGIKFLDVVRSYLGMPSLPVVVLTGLAGEHPMDEWERYLKVNSILAKGKATFEDIRRAIDEALHTPPG